MPIDTFVQVACQRTSAEPYGTPCCHQQNVLQMRLGQLDVAAHQDHGVGLSTLRLCIDSGRRDRGIDYSSDNHQENIAIETEAAASRERVPAPGMRDFEGGHSFFA
jgi:fructose/tagatose bisphosphate aldolase